MLCAIDLGLAGKTEWEEVKVDIVVDTADDILKPVPQFFRVEKDEKKKVDGYYHHHCLIVSERKL